MDNTYRIFEDWTPVPINDQITRAFEKASEKLVLCTDFEEKLVKNFDL